MAREKITPYLWFDDQVEEAVNFYVSVIPDSSVTAINRVGDRKIAVVEFRLAGVAFMAFNGGPHFKFNEAISLSVDCRSQAEVDELWEKLSAGGAKSQCGWLKDRYGLSWQIVPSGLQELVASGDGAKAARVWGALMKMTKIDIQALRDAADGK